MTLKQLDETRQMRRVEMILTRIFILAATVLALVAQTPPCGIAVIRTEGSKVEDRFVAAPPEHVKASVVKALPALGARLHKDKGMSIVAKSDLKLFATLQRKNQDSGVRGVFHKGLGALGTFKIDLHPETRDGLNGTLMHIEFHKNKFKGRIGNERYATPLAEEAGCLARILSVTDPLANPRGPAPSPTAEAREVTIPQGTPVKLILRDPLYSKDLNKKKNKKNPPAIPFEVSEDVKVDGSVIIRKGALGTAAVGGGKGARAYGRHAEIEFQIRSVTAVDGQSIEVAGVTEKNKGGRSNDTAVAVLSSPAFGWLIKGNEAFIRAGSAYEVEVAQQCVVKAGR